MPLPAADYNFFRDHGYLVLRDPLAPDFLREITSLYDEDRKKFAYCWHPFGKDQIINCDALATSPNVDRIIRHPPIMAVIEELMGGPVCFAEICLRLMEPHDGEPRQNWHRDKPHFEGHPLRLDYIQLMVYLTDVDAETHCFSISPESVDSPVLRAEDQLKRGGVVDLHGRAGTAILFNSSALHTATVRRTTLERKTIQTYYGHRDRAFISNDSLIPPTFWLNHSDAEARAFYGNLNEKSRHFARQFGVKV